MIETKEDEEQEIKYQEIISLLTAAGYFRARIKGLEPFDKVVGGMTWCIQTCSYDLEVDLLFRENSSIGDKIGLTEKIVQVLKVMDCPFNIEPHQIQGSDFIHIFPVVQWLVKKGIETRTAMAQFNRSYAILQFCKYNDIKQKPAFLPNEMLVKSLQHLRNRYDDSSKISKKSTLFDNGFRRFRHDDSSSCSEIEDNDDDDEIPLHELQDKIAILDNEISEIESSNKQLQSRVEQSEVTLSKNQETLNNLSLQSNESDIKSEDRDLYEQLQSLLDENITLKRKEKEFKKNCKERLHELETRNEKLKRELEEENKIENVDEIVDKSTKRLKQLREILAEKSSRAFELEHKIDEIPSQFELAQYQKRFLELYEILETKKVETDKFNVFLSILNDQYKFMTKEVEILESISELNPYTRLEFQTQLEEKADRVRKIRSSVEQTLKQEEDRRDSISKQLDTLFEYHRVYTLLVRDLRDAVMKNEKLVAKATK